MKSKAKQKRHNRRMLTAALRYATKRHWRVFPLRGKEPCTKHGYLDATTDRAQIKTWWTVDYPGANIGIACDSETGPIVVDFHKPKKPKKGKKELSPTAWLKRH